MMRFELVKVIADSHGFFSTKILPTEPYCFLEPTDIQSAEAIEEHLERNGVPYVLVQTETTLSEPTRYVRGYAIFVEISKEPMPRRSSPRPAPAGDSGPLESVAA